MNVPDNILQYYEDLRNYSSGNHTASMNPLGMDLFMKKGTAAWIAAWSDYKIDKISHLKSDTYTDLNHETAIPHAIHHEITVLLANMILSMEAQNEFYKEL